VEFRESYRVLLSKGKRKFKEEVKKEDQQIQHLLKTTKNLRILSGLTIFAPKQNLKNIGIISNKNSTMVKDLFKETTCQEEEDLP
jgi:phosphatidate phosphatase PAH1